MRAARGLPDDLVRISCGIEEVEDLIVDLKEALDGAAERFGTQAPPPVASANGSVSNGNGNGAAAAAQYGAASADVGDLVKRVQELEAALAAQNGTLSATSRQ